MKTREVVRRLGAAGLSQEDIARFLEIPWTRLAELIHDPSEQRRAELPKRRR
jgi:DNA-directed RNA polymerase specialized sigma24 family protein